MNLTLSEEQEMLKSMAHDFLVDKFPKTAIKEIEASESGYSPELWKEMAGLGWMGLSLPDKFGGSGMSFLDLAFLLEEMGRAATPGPFFSSVVLGGMTILDAGSDAQKDKYLPGIASGESIFTFALSEPNGLYDAEGVTLKADEDKGGYTLNGTKLFVPFANIAGHMIVVARTGMGANPEDGITLFIVDGKAQGLSATELKTIANDKLCEVVFKQVKVPAENVLGEVGKGWSIAKKAMCRAAAGKCCEMAGAMQAALDMTVAYAKDRKQFDKPIGSFQVIQHYCADMATDVDGIKLSAYKAAWSVSEGIPCDEDVAVAKAWAGQASQRILALAHQIHGAIGVTIDHDLQYYTRRAKGLEVSFGDIDFCKEVIASQMGL
ncbi:MAG: acyl-CoA/acyl-ACP dehydrogenase [Chloroflexi bacterium]|nr:acyl-CoA/acyl-ACP dehydrogenase [Chloroflexota bacterium]